MKVLQVMVIGLALAVMITMAALGAGCGIGSDCCVHCKSGCACGDSCISCSSTCHAGVGCACNGESPPTEEEMSK